MGATSADTRAHALADPGWPQSHTTNRIGWHSDIVMKREVGQRVFLVVGSPWLSALAAIRDEDCSDDPWLARGAFKPGDLLVTVLDTEPRAVLCVERLEEDSSLDDDVSIGEQWMASNLPPVSQIEANANALFPLEPGPIPARVADRLLDEIAMADALLSFDRSATSHGDLAVPYVRLNAVPYCLLCDRPVEPGDPDTRVYLGRRDQPGDDVDALLCACCSVEIGDSPYQSLVAHRIATRHPQCPRCAAFKTLFVALGKLQLPPDFAPRWPWEIPTGDAFDGTETQWICGACDYGWDYVLTLAHDIPGRRLEITPLWERNLDNRIVIARKHQDGDRFEPTSVLCAPLEPAEVMQMLMTIVNSTFAGDWSAALRVITDRSISAWEFMDHAVNEHSESIGNRAREVTYSGDPAFFAVPGVGIKTDYGPYEQAETGIGETSQGFYDVSYAYLIDDNGTADILTAQTEYQVVENGQTLTGEEEVWSHFFALASADYCSSRD